MHFICINYYVIILSQQTWKMHITIYAELVYIHNTESRNMYVVVSLQTTQWYVLFSFAGSGSTELR